ncbi:uncharacterized protein J3R85_016791 [Psidium guajava]|nr:uncharacterized protein J3R85_016791 [Psidium guajava]
MMDGEQNFRESLRHKATLIVPLFTWPTFQLVIWGWFSKVRQNVQTSIWFLIPGLCK